MLAHELAHIHHRDFAALLWAQLGLIVHFYNPFVHWLANRMKLEQELAADAVAARVAGGHREYLRVLAKLALEHDDQNVGWPARAFLPTRHSFLRRLEMLRVSKAPPAGSGPVGRWLGMAAIAALAIALVALRPRSDLAIAQTPGATTPALNATAQNTQTTQAAQAEPAASQYELRYLGEDQELVAGARPAQLLGNSPVGALVDVLGKQLFRPSRASLWSSPQEIEQVVVGMNAPLGAAQSMSLYVKWTKPKSLAAEDVQGKPVTINGQNAFEIDAGLVVWQPDNRSAVISARSSIERFMAGRVAAKPFTSTQSWLQASKDPAFAWMSGKTARSQWQSRQIPPTLVAGQFGVTIASAIVDESESFAVSGAFENELRLACYAECQDAQGPKKIQEVLDVALPMLKQDLASVATASTGEARVQGQDGGATIRGGAPAAGEPLPLASELLKLAIKGLDNLQSKSQGKLLSITTRIDGQAFPAMLLATTVSATRRAASRQTSAVNLQQMGIAIHNYHETYRVLPQSAITQVSDKQTPLKYPYSWRVAILPFIEQADLYGQYKFNEPWDSPANLKILEKMPAIYRHGDAPPDSTNTSYVVLSGDATMFPTGRPLSLADVTDGTSNTLMVVEAKTSIPWTKPEDLVYAPDQPLPKLGGYSQEGYNVLLGDGTVRFFSKTLDENVLRKVISARGQDGTK